MLFHDSVPSQVVLGVLGCPNMPTTPLVDADGGDGAASHVGTDGVGVLFTAQYGCGAAVVPLSGVRYETHWSPCCTCTVSSSLPAVQLVSVARHA